MYIPRSTKIFIAILILAGVLGGALAYPLIYFPKSNTAQAQLLNCIGSEMLKHGIEVALDYAMDLLHSRYSNGGFGFGGILPIKEDVQRIKEAFSDTLVRCVARMHFDVTITGILSIIRTKGREGTGEPLFIRNWRNFETMSQYRGEQFIRSILSTAPICGYLRNSTFGKFGITSSHRISLDGINIRVGNLNPFSLRTKCPLPSSFDLAAYEQDPIANGGWQAFEMLLQANPYMTEMFAIQEMQIQRAAEVSADLGEGGAGDGYLSVRGSNVQGSGPSTGKICNANNKCPAGQECKKLVCSISKASCTVTADCPVNEFCDGTCFSLTATDPSCRVRGPNGQCIIYSDIRTPGSSLAGSVEATVQQELAWITNVDELEELVIAYITSRLKNRLMDLGADEPPAQYANMDSPAPIPTLAPPPPGPTPPPPPGGGCFAFPIPCSGITCDVVQGSVISAVDQYIADNPGKMGPGNLVLDPAHYMNGVVAILASMGITARIGPGAAQDEVEVKQPGDGSAEHFDILTGGNIAWTNCVGTWTPPLF